MDLGIAGQVAVVTGGASGIGRAVVGLLLEEGANVAIWDVVTDVTSIAEEIDDRSPQRVIGCCADVTRQDSIDDALRRTEESCGPVDHLIHAAAIGSGKFGFPFTNLDPEDWPRVLEVNVMGMTRVAHALAPRMMERRSGTMTFLSSVAGQIGSPSDPPYSAAKAANINFAQCIAKDVAEFGVRANVVCPGMVKTPLNRSVWQSWNDRQPAENRVDYDTWAEDKIRTLIPLGTWQKSEDIANMVVFLTSKRASQVTGQTINVDGGFVMHS